MRGEAFGPADVQRHDHFLDVHFDRRGRYEGELRIFGEPASFPSRESQPKRVLRCGPFDLRLWYWTGESGPSSLSGEEFAFYKARLERFGGLLLYRDGLRVLPYGKVDFDWLRFEERRSRSAARYFFSHRRMFGYVAISREGNPELRDKAGREGLKSGRAVRSSRARPYNPST